MYFLCKTKYDLVFCFSFIYLHRPYILHQIYPTVEITCSYALREPQFERVFLSKCAMQETKRIYLSAGRFKVWGSRQVSAVWDHGIHSVYW